MPTITWTIADTCNKDCICDTHNFYNEECSDAGCSDQNCDSLHVTISGAMSGDGECICMAVVTGVKGTQTKDVWSSSCVDNWSSRADSQLLPVIYECRRGDYCPGARRL